MRVAAARVTALIIGGLLTVTGCTSEQGALPPPATPVPTAPGDEDPPSEEIAGAALLTTTDLGPGFDSATIDAAQRWTDALDATSRLVALRPNCGEELARITATLSDTPSDAAGAAFTDTDGHEVVHFVGVATPEAGAALVEAIASLVNRCDAYKLQVPERGSLAMTVEPMDFAALTSPPGVTATGWQTTVFSDHLRWRQQYSALSVDGIVSFLTVTGSDITGEPPMSEDELADLLATAIERSEEAGR